MPFFLIQNDITKMKTDVIVNAANTMLEEGIGVSRAIFQALGSNAALLREECRQKAPCLTGQSVVTGSYGLAAKWIIHTVGPVWQEDHQEEGKQQLMNCYRTALELTKKLTCHSIAFPLISSGYFGYPREEVLDIAQKTIFTFLQALPDDYSLYVYLVVFDPQAIVLRKGLKDDIDLYVKKYYQENKLEDHLYFSKKWNDWEQKIHFSKENPTTAQPSKLLNAAVQHVEESFSTTLFRLMGKKGYKNSEVYKRANISKQLFSKICSNEKYHPKKKTVFALAIALQLNVRETDAFLQRAGYSISYSQKMDIIISYFLTQEIYDIYLINDVLFCYGEKGL